MHDRAGEAVSYDEYYLNNGRDDDGDGQVDEIDEARNLGVWYEMIFAVPHPGAID